MLKNTNFMLMSLQIENFSDVELNMITNHDIQSLTVSSFGTLLLKNFLLNQYFRRLLIVSKTNFAVKF